MFRIWNKKNTNIFFALYDGKLMIFWRKRDIHYEQNCAVGSGAPCCLTHVKMFIFWRKEWKANKLKKMVILIYEKKKKNMKHEAMVLILWIFYRKRIPLANGCSHALKLIHIKIWIFPHEYPTKKTKFGKMKKIKNGKCENKNTLKVPKKPSVLDYKNIFIKASIPSITRFFVFF